jgi:hypothetical protein
MPAINPDDYNIDKFNSQNLGPITVSDFRDYILNHNLPGIDPLVSQNGYSNYGLNIYAPLLFNPTNSVQDIPDLSNVSFTPSQYNNNTSPRPDNLKENIWTTDDPFYGSPTNEETYEVTYKALENPGSIDTWLNEGGFETDVFTIRNIVHLTNNEWGPSYVYDYSDPENVNESTGYQQYPTSSGGEGAGIIGSIVGKTLGFSTNNFIDFPSGLQDIAKERRAVELENRIKLNFVEDTLGNINLDPLGLLAGQSLITPNYTITRPKNFIGRAAQFTASLTGFKLPVSIIPGDDRTKLSSNGFQEDLIDYTGKGQKDLLYFNVYSSKYAPETLTKGWDPDDATKDSILGRIGQFFDDLGKAEGDTYLTISKTTANENKTFAQKVGQFFNNLITPESDKSLIPTPEKLTSPNDPFVTMGTEGQYPAIESLDENSDFVEYEYEQPPLQPTVSPVEYFPNKTTLKPGFSDDITGQNPATDTNFYWADRSNSVAKRGLLKFTQDMINAAETNGHKGGARFIGRFDSDSNLTQVGDRKKHSQVSKGNLVRNSDNTYYCRSWSTRNPYQTHEDLIRADRLYRLRNETNYLSVLEDNGHVKIAPYADPDLDDNKVEGGVNKGNEIKRHMFSIENLAWMDAREKIGLKPCEVGPNGGRIMWFPPYEIAFTENISANWNTNTLLGRGEPIYTYNSTERKGTLSWAIITDHPSSIKKLKKESEENLYRYFAGCGITLQKLDEIFGTEIIEKVQIEKTQKEEEDIENSKTEEEQQDNNEQNPLPEPQLKDTPVLWTECIFRNAGRDKEVNGVRTGVGRNITEELEANYGLNSCTSPECKTTEGENITTNEDFLESIDKLVDFLSTEDGQYWGLKLVGKTSGAANKEYNRILSRDRAEGVYEYIINRLKNFVPPPSAGVGITGGTIYVPFEEQNFGNPEEVVREGWVCTDTDQNLCKSETAKVVNNKLTYQQKLSYIDPTNPQYDPQKLVNSRFVIVAEGEEGAGSDSADEDAIAGNTDKNSWFAISDRAVFITVNKNQVYIDKKLEQEKQIPKEEEEAVKAQEPSTAYNIKLPGFSNSVNIQPFIDIQNNLQTLDNLKQFEGFTGKDLIDRQNLLTQSSKEETGAAEPTDESPIGEDVEDNNVDDETLRNVIRIAVDALYTECDYFLKIKKSDPFIYKTLVEKLKYFHPAFHSTTPEGLNSRLTFLQQCMRQGPNIQSEETKTKNSAFGRPPVCILRIGDFWYTKIIIDSFNVNYEPLVWDLNPEGIGVQPMIAKVDLSFSMIGGSSLDGPIKQLQNAVSFNYYANTSVYNSRRYYDSNDETGNTFKTLEERLSELANETLGENEIGFGAFKSQSAANKEINNLGSSKNTNPQNQLIETSNDKKEQTNNVTQQPTEPIAPLSDLPTQTNLQNQEDFENAQQQYDTLFELTNLGVFENEEEFIQQIYPGAITPIEQLENTIYKIYTDTGSDIIDSTTPINNIFIELTESAKSATNPWSLGVIKGFYINGLESDYADNNIETYNIPGALKACDAADGLVSKKVIYVADALKNIEPVDGEYEIRIEFENNPAINIGEIKPDGTNTIKQTIDIPNNEFGTCYDFYYNLSPEQQETSDRKDSIEVFTITIQQSS